MRKIQVLFSGVLLAVFSLSGALAQTQEKRVDKTFNVNSSTRLSIDNRFGKVHINTWDQNKIEVKVLVQAEGSTAQAQNILDRITIDIDESPSEISLETEIENSRKKWNNDRFKIDYTIKMPKSNPLHINHRHGDIYLDNYSGPLDLDLAHGQIVAEELTGKGRISLRHGSGGRISAIGSGSLEIQHYQRLRVGSLGSMDVEIAHATMEVERAGDLDLEVRHSTLEMGSAGALDLSLQHGKLEAGSIRSLRTEMQHSSISLEKVQQLLDVDANHSEVDVDRMLKGFSAVTFEGNHSYLGLELETGSSANFRADLTHGKLHYTKSDIDMNFINTEDNRAEYRGKIGSNPTGEIRIEGNFTDCSVSFN